MLILKYLFVLYLEHYIIYTIECEVLKVIVSYIEGKWENFRILSHVGTDNNNYCLYQHNNYYYDNAEACTANMSRHFTYGGFCCFCVAELFGIFFF